ncbi:MAG: hypothetical protein ACYC7L_16245 [Nitrospirota bacterium]
MTYASVSSFRKRSPLDANIVEYYDTAVGEESEVIAKERIRSVEHYLFPFSRKWSTPFARFHSLKNQWELDTALKSSVSEIIMHAAYQQIIGMGPTAIPFILSEMKEKRGHWFWALKSITGEDPVAPIDRGNLKKMTEAWLEWGREQGYIR